jgi:serine/threonine-protein kinase HipA
MKLPMAVGDSRHTAIDSIMPRHFLQTAGSSGVSAALVQGILDGLEDGADRAIDAALNDLPAGFRRRSFHPSLKACAGVLARILAETTCRGYFVACSVVIGLPDIVNRRLSTRLLF